MNTFKTKLTTVSLVSMLVIGLTGAAPRPAGASTSWYSRTQEITVPLSIYMQSLNIPPATIQRVVASTGTLFEAMADNSFATTTDIASFMHTFNSLAVYWGTSPTQLNFIDQVLVNPMWYVSVEHGYNLNTPLGSAIAQSGLSPVTAASMIWPGIDSHPLVSPQDITGFAHDIQGLRDTQAFLQFVFWSPMTHRGYAAYDPNVELALAYTQNIWDTMNPDGPDPFAPASTASAGCCYSGGGGPHQK